MKDMRNEVWRDWERGGGLCDSGEIFIVCINCGKEKALRFPNIWDSVISDEEATKMFNGLGWTVKPTLCPECIAKGITE